MKKGGGESIRKVKSEEGRRKLGRGRNKHDGGGEAEKQVAP